MATLYKTGTDLFLNKGYQYVYGGSGSGKNRNGIVGIDCSHLVHSALRAAGYSIPYMTTSELNTAKAQKYFEIVTIKEATSQLDDFILYESHVGIFHSFSEEKKEGSFLGAQSRGPGIAKFDEQESVGWGLDCKILRPKKEFKLSSLAHVSASMHSQKWSGQSTLDQIKKRWSKDEDVHQLGCRRWGCIRIIE